MAQKFLKQRLRTSFLSVIISQSLVLFVLGIFGIIVYNAREIANNLKENLTILVVLKTDTPTAEARRLQKILETDERIRRTELITKQEAAETLKKELDEDFVEFLGYNPLSDVIEVNLFAKYAEDQYITSIEEYLKSEASVDEVVVDRNLIYLMNANIKKISMIAAGMVVILLIVSVGLINSSIRLAVYSARFTVRTMQLVGATRWFIIQPFLRLGLIQGLLSGLLASLFILALFNYSSRWTSDLFTSLNPYIFYWNIPVLSFLGMVISVVCTFFALNKYLKSDIEQLYL